LILVDASAWVELFRGRDPVASAVDALLEADELALCGPIVTEIRRGRRTPAERRQVLPLLSGCRFLEEPPRLWEEARDLGFARIRSAGLPLGPARVR
jgi:predicted nucleic acid-binding protein